MESEELDFLHAEQRRTPPLLGSAARWDLLAVGHKVDAARIAVGENEATDLNALAAQAATVAPAQNSASSGWATITNARSTASSANELTAGCLVFVEGLGRLRRSC